MRVERVVPNLTVTDIARAVEEHRIRGSCSASKNTRQCEGLGAAQWAVWLDCAVRIVLDHVDTPLP